MITLGDLRSRLRGLRASAGAVVVAVSVQGLGFVPVPGAASLGGDGLSEAAAPRAVPPAPDGTAWGIAPEMSAEAWESESRRGPTGSDGATPLRVVHPPASGGPAPRLERPIHLPHQARLRAGSSRWATTVPPPWAAPRSARRS